MTPPAPYRYWLPWALAGLGWCLVSGAMHAWVGRMIVDGSERTAFLLLIVCFFVLLSYPVALAVVRWRVSLPWLRRSIARGALLAFFLGATAPAWFFLHSARWELYTLVEQARSRVEMASRNAGHVIPLQQELARWTATPRLAAMNREELREVAAASSSAALLSAFRQAQVVGRGAPLGAEEVLANGLVRPREVAHLRHLAEELEGSGNAYDQALVHLIEQAPSH